MAKFDIKMLSQFAFKESNQNIELKLQKSEWQLRDKLCTMRYDFDISARKISKTHENMIEYITDIEYITVYLNLTNPLIIQSNTDNCLMRIQNTTVVFL